MPEGRFHAASDAIFDALRDNERALQGHRKERGTVASIVRMHDGEIERLEALITQQRDLLIAIDPRCHSDEELDEQLAAARNLFAVGFPDEQYLNPPLQSRPGAAGK